MGDSSTKPEFWLISLGFLIILVFGLLAFGVSIRNSQEITLDEDSKNYLDNYNKSISNIGIDSYANREKTAEDSKNPIQKALTSIKNFIDVFGVFSLLTSILSGFWSFIVLMFQLPSFFIETLGLPLGNFRFITNVISFILGLLATIMLVRLKK